jgi:transglutaminase-like putative cysteine protease
MLRNYPRPPPFNARAAHGANRAVTDRLSYVAAIDLPSHPSLIPPPEESTMKSLTVRHLTVYRYTQPVRFGEHRLMFRPRDSHDMRLLETKLTISPPAQVRWLHDVFSNSVTIASFSDMAEELRFESEIRLEHYGVRETDFPLDASAETYPFQYAAQELPDLLPSIERRYADPEGRLDDWLKAFYSGTPVDTQDLLTGITHAIRQQLVYQPRDQFGTQSPAETLASGTGTCRDYALLMIEALRTLGLGARFVTGYLYDMAADMSPSGLVGGAATHAWVQVYLPGAGWAEFDPTNGTVGGENLIRVGAARNPSQSVPLQGSFEGPTNSFIGMTVDVQVTQA